MRILVVDEDHAFQERVASVLEPAGIRCEPALNTNYARKALSRLGEVAIDLVLLSTLAIPGSGWELLRELRSEGNDVPVILFTVAEEDRMHQVGLELGADDTMPHTFKAVDLKQRISAALGRHGPGRDGKRTRAV